MSDSDYGGDWKDKFLQTFQSVAESLERLRTPNTPIAIQQSAKSVRNSITLAANASHLFTFVPPGNGYNRVMLHCLVPGIIPLFGTFSYGFSQENPQTMKKLDITGSYGFLPSARISSVAAGVPSYTMDINQVTLEIPDGDIFLMVNATNGAAATRVMTVTTTWFRQY